MDVVEFPKVARARIDLVARESIDAIDMSKLYTVQSTKTEPERSSKRLPLPHQREAVEAWVAQGDVVYSSTPPVVEKPLRR